MYVSIANTSKSATATDSCAAVITTTIPTFQGQGAAVTFQQDAAQANALFVSFYGGQPDFAFMSLGPTNLHPRALQQGEQLEGSYVINVSEV
jgi:hypothetical protein